MNGAGQGKDVNAGGAVFLQQVGDLFKGGARVEEIVNHEDAFACDVAFDGEGSRHVGAFLGKGLEFFLRLRLAGFCEDRLHGYLDFIRKRVAECLYRINFAHFGWRDRKDDIHPDEVGLFSDERKRLLDEE